MNDRLKEVRKSFGFNQTEFGKRIGVTVTAVSKMELGTYNVTDTMIKLICTEFNVSETWLRTGEGNMTAQAKTFSLDELAQKNNLTSFEFDIVKALMTLDEDTRQALISHFKNAFASQAETSATLPPRPALDDLPDEEYGKLAVQLRNDEKRPESSTSSAKGSGAV